MPLDISLRFLRSVEFSVEHTQDFKSILDRRHTTSTEYSLPQKTDIERIVTHVQNREYPFIDPKFFKDFSAKRIASLLIDVNQLLNSPELDSPAFLVFLALQRLIQIKTQFYSGSTFFPKAESRFLDLRELLSKHSFLSSCFYSSKKMRSIGISAEIPKQCLEREPRNITRKEVLPCDLQEKPIRAVCPFFLTSDAFSMPGTAKRPRVDPRSLLRPVARYYVNNKLAFEQCTSILILGRGTQRKETSVQHRDSNDVVSLSFFDLTSKSVSQANLEERTLNLKLISRFHACVYYDEIKKEFWVINYGKSGVFVDNRRYTMETLQLTNDMQFSIGSVCIRIEIRS